MVEGIGNNQTLLRFTHVDRSDTSREFSIVIDVSNRTYKGWHLRFSGFRILIPLPSPNNEPFFADASDTTGRSQRVKGPLCVHKASSPGV